MHISIHISIIEMFYCFSEQLKHFCENPPIQRMLLLVEIKGTILFDFISIFYLRNLILLDPRNRSRSTNLTFFVGFMVTLKSKWAIEKPIKKCLADYQAIERHTMAKNLLQFFGFPMVHFDSRSPWNWLKVTLFAFISYPDRYGKNGSRGRRRQC